MNNIFLIHCVTTHDPMSTFLPRVKKAISWGTLAKFSMTRLCLPHFPSGIIEGHFMRSRGRQSFLQPKTMCASLTQRYECNFLWEASKALQIQGLGVPHRLQLNLEQVVLFTVDDVAIPHVLMKFTGGRNEHVLYLQIHYYKCLSYPDIFCLRIQLWFLHRNIIKECMDMCICYLQLYYILI